MATIVKRGTRYRVQVRRTGQPSLSKSFARRSDAKRWAADMEARAQEVDAGGAATLTLKDALARYLKEVTPSKKGHKAEADRIRAWQHDALASRSLASIRTADIAAWRDRKRKEGKAPTTIRNCLTIISQTYRTAISEWDMEGLKNPVRDVRLPKLGPARDRRLEPGEEQRLLAACSRFPWLEPIVAFAIHTAMRRGEMLSLRREDVKGRMAMLKETKHGKPRSVPLSRKALEIVAALPVSLDGKLFPLKPTVLDHCWRRACKLAGIADLHSTP